MSSSPEAQFTLLLARYRNGEDEAGNALVSLVHDDLHRIARHYLRRNVSIATLSPTMLVNEVYFRLVSKSARRVSTRAHFLSLAATAMRQIIVDYARKALREQQSFDRNVDLSDWDELGLQADELAGEILWLHDALKDLAKVNERAAKVVECRFFAGLDEDETAQAMRVSRRTVERIWAEARSWLKSHLTEA